MLQVRTVLFPTDFSACAEHAFAHAAFLADRYGAELHVLHVRDGGLIPDDLLAGLALTQAEVCEQLRIPAEACGRNRGRRTVRQVTRTGVPIAEQVIAYAEEHGADLLVMGTHGRTGVKRAVLGSVAEQAVRLAPCPVLTVGEAASRPRPPRRILVPTDLSDRADAAVPVAAELARAYGGHLRLLHVVEPVVLPAPYAMALEPLDTAALLEGAQKALRAVAARADLPAGTVETQVEVGPAAATVLDVAAREDVDLIV
ncbi:MAG: universal stress protein, partial [Rhodothermales bacterium]|nr:universal stress protein [Rhodothermales bacterium]